MLADDDLIPLNKRKKRIIRNSSKNNFFGNDKNTVDIEKI